MLGLDLGEVSDDSAHEEIPPSYLVLFVQRGLYCWGDLEWEKRLVLSPCIETGDDDLGDFGDG